MPLRDHLTTDQIDRAVVDLLPGEVLFIKDGKVMKANFRTRAVEEFCAPKRKTKRGRRGSK